MCIAAKYSNFFGVTPIFRAYSGNPIFQVFPPLLQTCIICIVVQTFLQYFNLLIFDYYLRRFSILHMRCLFPILNCFIRASTVNSVMDVRCYLQTKDLVKSSYCHVGGKIFIGYQKFLLATKFF